MFGYIRLIPSSKPLFGLQIERPDRQERIPCMFKQVCLHGSLIAWRVGSGRRTRETTFLKNPPSTRQSPGNEDGRQGVNPTPAYSTDPSGLRDQPGASPRLIAYNEHLVNPPNPEKAKQQIQDFLKNRTNGESGFLDLTPIYDKLSEYGLSIYEKGMTFADWSKRMISDLGDKVKDVLAKVWNAYKSLGNAGSIGSKSDDFAKRVEEGQRAKAEKLTSAHTGEELSLDSVKNPDSRERIQAELDRRSASSPDARTKIYENAAKRLDAITKRQNAVMEAFARGDVSSSDVIKKDMERNLVEVNAILSAFPPNIRASLSRNWRNPTTGEPGNIYAKYASLGSEKAKADYLIRTIARADKLIDRSLAGEYREKIEETLRKAKPTKSEGGIKKSKYDASTNRPSYNGKAADNPLRGLIQKKWQPPKKETGLSAKTGCAALTKRAASAIHTLPKDLARGNNWERFTTAGRSGYMSTLSLKFLLPACRLN